jgi:seryl-tRNA synthetase
MLDIKTIRENPDLIKKNIKNRGMDVDVDRLLELDERNRELIVKIDSMRSELKAGSKSKPTEKEILKMKKLGDEIKSLDQEHEKVKSEFLDLRCQIPNLTHSSSPIGKDDSENVEIERVGEPTKFDFEPKDHLTLGKDLDLLDFEAGAKVAGNGFYFFKNELVILELALINYAFEKLVAKGFTPIATPDLARGNIMDGTGYNPKGNEDQIYEIKGEDLSLIATSEITVGGYLSNTVLNEEDLDKKYVAFSHCFRREAGAYGKESRGLYRVHQFSKVEMFIFCKPENSEKLHQEIKEIEKEIFSELGIPFRVVDICTGDLGGPAYRKYDLEGWMPMKNDWGEITSCSNCTDYQARRLNIKYKTKKGEKEFVHTLNGTAITSSRTPLVILENYQQADGSVKIPEVLQKYTGFKEIKR